MNTAPSRRSAPTPSQLQFRALERFPCGCIALVQQTNPLPVTVVSIEAKGPHCTLTRHRLGKVLRLGEVWDEPDEEGGDE